MVNRSVPRDDEPLTDALVLDDVQAAAARAGMALDADEAGRLVPGFQRVRAMAAEVRELIDPGVQPGDPQVAPWPARARR